MKFRTEWVLVPLFCIATWWLVSAVRPAYVWNDLMTQWGIHDKRQFTMLACLGCVACAICAIARVLRQRDEE